MSFKDKVDRLGATDVMPTEDAPARVPVAQASDFKPAAIKEIVRQMRLGHDDDTIHAAMNTEGNITSAGLAAFIPPGWTSGPLNVVKKSHIRRIRRRWEERKAALAPQEP